MFAAFPALLIHAHDDFHGRPGSNCSQTENAEKEVQPT
jgi:hypothetical protein